LNPIVHFRHTTPMSPTRCIIRKRHSQPVELA